MQVFLVCYTICITIAVHYGFGQDISRLIHQNSRHLPLALLFEAIGQTFAIVGMVLARWSSAFLLLRLTKPLIDNTSTNHIMFHVLSHCHLCGCLCAVLVAVFSGEVFMVASCPGRMCR
ncbi:hypothetical protein QL093DRAFT_1130095 [Fusarium oxysporum]|nr:hypothetical protein QL093DRAFT_1130095 [Fusarium oxysporum]